MNIQDLDTAKAEDFENDKLIEEMWAMKAYEHADVYFNLLCAVEPKNLKLTSHDDEIYTTFRHDFPDFEVGTVDENCLKSVEGKDKWRSFIEKFDKVEDFNNGTLLRTNAKSAFGPDNSMLVVRIQFLAIEIARNREGYNDSIRKLFGANS